MGREATGGGRLLNASQAGLIRASFGAQAAAATDLNRATARDLAALGLSPRTAGAVVALRRRGKIVAPADLFHAGLVDRDQLRRLDATSFGARPARPLMQRIGIAGPVLHVGEPCALTFAWLPAAPIKAEILSIRTRFPSGRVAQTDIRLSAREAQSGRLTVGGFVSGESGELHVLATLRDAGGGISRQSALFTVVTRNPVQMYLTPDFVTQSGSAGAPKFDFGDRRWYCHTHVRWVNGETRSVNLGRRVDVHVTDAGIGTVTDFSFNLSGDIVIPALSTVYGTLFTSHGSGGVFDEFSAKGDLTFRYTMSGGGFSPQRSMVWRTMRTMGYNIIRVGDFSASERSEYTRAARDIASGIFRSRDMTVHGVELYRIEGSPALDADKARFRFIDSQAEINDMRSKYTVNNWYLDVFFVEGRWDGAAGSSPTNGAVDKQGAASGLVIPRDADTVNLGQTFAHEAGHYFGLDHADEDDGCADTDPASPTISDNFIFSSSRRDSAVITNCQINAMRQHGLVRSMTP